jgi:hypothetical protein
MGLILQEEEAFSALEACNEPVDPVPVRLPRASVAAIYLVDTFYAHYPKVKLTNAASRTVIVLIDQTFECLIKLYLHDWTIIGRMKHTDNRPKIYLVAENGP